MTTETKLVTGKKLPPGRIPTLPQSYVFGLFGDRGSGKSAAMAYYGIQEAEAGRPIFYYPEDFGLKIPGAEAMGPADLVTMPDRLTGATVLIDEVQEVLSKFRTNAISSLLLMAFFRQTRKRGANVIFTSNDPNGINSALSTQTDLHAMCRMITDPRCYEVGYHLKSCADTVRMRIKDTNGKHGLLANRKDGRKGMVQHLVGIGDVYPFYNTGAIADPAEVMGMNKRSLLEQRAQQKLGMSWDEFDAKLISEIIPMLVNNGYEAIVPGTFVKTLQNEMNIPAKPHDPLDSRELGKRLKGIGLVSTRRAKGMVYQLPPKQYLQEWADGVWSPGLD